MTESRTAGEEIGQRVTRHLLLGDIALEYPLTPTPDTALLAVRLADEEGEAGRATEYLTPEDTRAQDVHLLRPAARLLPDPPPGTSATWSGIAPADGFAAFLVASLPREVSTGALAPVMLLRTHRDAARPFTEVLSCVRLRKVGVLFVRTARFPHEEGAPIGALAESALRMPSDFAGDLLSEGRGLTTFESGTEIEQKITLGGDASVWRLTKELWARADRGGLGDFIPEPGYELTRWHFAQHTYEVLEPAGERGYLAFLRGRDGRWNLKRKRFEEEALRREETFQRGVAVTESTFGAFLATEYPELTVRRLPDFRRTRFDVNVESTRTGHAYGIEIDEVTVEGEGDGGPRVLRQLEIEYLHSRRHEGLDPASIDSDIAELTSRVEDHLKESGTPGERTFYSKLAFLQECAGESAARG
jgi:hypothetical protein